MMMVMMINKIIVTLVIVTKKGIYNLEIIDDGKDDEDCNSGNSGKKSN